MILNVKIKGRYTDTKSGYVQLYLENGKVIEEHRYVMIQYLQRELTSEEIIHHIDEDKQNNAIENLQLSTRSEHVREHKKGVRLVEYITLTCGWCNESFEMIPSRYKYKIKKGQINFYCCRSHQVSAQHR